MKWMSEQVVDSKFYGQPLLTIALRDPNHKQTQRLHLVINYYYLFYSMCVNTWRWRCLFNLNDYSYNGSPADTPINGFLNRLQILSLRDQSCTHLYNIMDNVKIHLHFSFYIQFSTNTHTIKAMTISRILCNIIII